MYQTGNFSTLQARMHQLVTGKPDFPGDLSSYQTEASGYAGTVEHFQLNLWQREINHKTAQFNSGFSSHNG